MTVTYHAGRRVQGLSTDVANTPTLEDDFTSDNFDTQGTKNQVNTGTGVIDFDFNRDGSNHKTKIDTTLGNEFVVRWTQTWDNIAYISGNPIGFIGLGNTAETVNIQSTTNDFLGFEIVVMNSGVVELRAVSAIGENINLSTQDDILTKSPAENETLGYEIIRYSDTDWKINIYDSTFTTLEDTTGLLTTASSSLDTTNFMVATFPTGSQSSQGDGTIDNLEIYNGVSSLTNKPTNVQVGSRFEETDTRKMYVYIEREDSNDFSTDNMVDSDSSRIGISSGVFSANLQRDGSNDASTYTLSNTYGNEFNMKYEFQTNGLNGSPSGTFGLYSEDNTSGSTTTHDSFVALNFNDLVLVRLQAGDNTAPYGGTGTSGSWITLTANTNYFVEIVGNGDDTFTLNIRTGSHTGTLLGTQTITQTGIDNLSYWGAKNTMSSGTSGTIVTLDNLSISASSIWKEIGT